MALNNTYQGMTARFRQVGSLWARFRHLNWAMSDQGMVSAVNFLTAILLARYLGPENFGRFTLAWLAVEFIQSAQQSLVISPMLSIGPKKEPDQRAHYFGSVVSAQFIFTVVSLALLVAIIFGINVVKPDWGLLGLLLPLTCVSLVSQAQNFARRYLFSCRRGEAAMVIDLVRYGGQIVILWPLLLFVTMSVADSIWVIACTSTVSALIGGFMLERLSWRRDVFGETVRQHLAFGKWLISSELCRWGAGNLFVIASGALLGPTAVGVIRAAQNLVGLCHILLLGLENVIPAQAAREYAVDGGAALLRLLEQLVLWGTLAIGGILLVVSVAPEFWLHLVYGEKYVGYGYLVQWWAAIYFFSFFILTPVYGLRAIEKTKGIFVAQLLAALFTAIAVYPLISHLGITGVMVGNIAVVAIQLTVLFRIFFHHVPYRRAALCAEDG